MKLNFLGVPIYMNGQNYFVPSLSYQDFKANYALLIAAPPQETGPEMMEFFDARIPVIGMAIRRNYPEVTDDELRGWLDMTTLPLAIQAVGAASGIKPVAEGE